MKKGKMLSRKINSKLNTKISYKYTFSDDEYPELMSSAEIVAEAYRKASVLFDAGSSESIAALTLTFYMDHIDEAINMYTNNLDDFNALLKLLSAYTKIYIFMNDKTDSFESLLANELSENKDYYELFPLSYYEDLCLTDGIRNALAELDNDVNTRAFTFYNSAHTKYQDFLPGLRNLLIQYGNKRNA